MARRKRRMTSAKFFRTLKQTREAWETSTDFFAYGRIRCWVDLQSYCPVTRVYKKMFGVHIGTHNWETAARDLGLDLRFARRLTNAADNTGHYRLRQKLLRATGLA